jgi:ABC-2 type transport system ATP-binding protein
MITVDNLTKIYPGVVAVDHISFTVEPGEIVGFLGPNGAGKTTTMRILTCFIPPTSGRASVAGFDVIRESLQVRRKVGYLPENNPLYAEMRVQEYLNFRAKLKKLPRSERKRNIGDAIQRCGLSEVRKRIIGHLSKGYRQRVGLADAIVHNPEIIILDEPTIGLDPNQVRQVRQLIHELGQKRTVILSTHILSEVEIMCNKVIIIHQGRIVASGTTEEITQQLRYTTRRIHLEVRGDGEAIRGTLENMVDVERVKWVREGRDGVNIFSIETKDKKDIREALFDQAVSNNWSIRELSAERITLEDAFAELTGGAAI